VLVEQHLPDELLEVLAGAAHGGLESAAANMSRTVTQRSAALLVHPQHGAPRESRLTCCADTLSTHFGRLPASTDRYGRPRMVSLPRSKARICSEKACSERERSMAELRLTMEVLYQLS